VDLLGELDDIDVALERLRSAAAVDLGDHFRVIITGHDRIVLGTGQPHVDGYRVHVDAYCGAVKSHTFGVDLVTGSLMTTSPDLQTPHPALNLRGLTPPTLRLYPVVDHMADKLYATQSTYGAAGDRPSSRVRDLVDLVVSPDPKTWTVTNSSMPSARSGITRAWQVTPCSTLQRTGGGCTHRWPGPSVSARG